MIESARVRVLAVFGNIPLYGHERANVAVFTALKDYGVEVLFATNREWGALHVTPYLDRLGLRWKPVTFATLSGPNAEPMLSPRTLGRIAKGNVTLLGLIREYDPDYLYVANETFLITMLPALLLSRRPLVYRAGDSPQQHRGLFRTLWRHVIGWRAAAVVCVSQFIAARVKAAGVPDTKVRVIYTYPSTRTGTDDVRAAVARRFPSEVVVAYAGQLTADKGVDVLVEAALRACRKRTDLRFIIAGDYAWKNPFAQSLLERVAAAGLTDRIAFLGMIDAVHQLFESSDLHVCPSVWDEPLANVVLEAKAAGIPSVIFPVGGLPEVVDHLVDGYVCKAATADALEEGIEYLADNREARRRLGQNARASLDARFGPERFRREWRAVFFDR